MTLAFTTVGVIGKRREPAVKPVLAAICTTLQGLGCTVLVDELHADIAQQCGAEAVNRSTLATRCQLAVVAGGDGTLLDAGRSLARYGVPLLGINQGRLGFMVDVNPDDLTPALHAVMAGDYVTDERRMLATRIVRDGQDLFLFAPAINDVVIRNFASIRMLEFKTWLGGHFISQHRADGLIVSSPTGSTAYSLSGGGPVIHPAVAALALVPICPHTLTDRPIVVPSDQAVKIVLRGPEEGRATVTCDGQLSEALMPGDTVLIEPATTPLKLLHPRQYDYFSLLREKLHWGRGPAR